MAISNAVDPSAVARVVGIETVFRDLRGGRVTLLPQRVAVIGQGSTASTYTTTKRQVNSALEVGSMYGFGSPLHLAVSQLLPVNGDGVGTIPVTVYPLQDNAAGTAATRTITVTGTATATAPLTVRINGMVVGVAAVTTGDNADTIASCS